MVDSTKGVGPIQNIVPSNKLQTSSKKAEGGDTVSTPRTDTVEISTEAQEALSVAQAEKAAQEIRSELQKDLDRVLGIDPSFAEQL